MRVCASRRGLGRSASDRRLLAPFTGRSVPSKRGTATPQIEASVSAALGSELASLRCTKSSKPPSTPQPAALQLNTPAVRFTVQEGRSSSWNGQRMRVCSCWLTGAMP